MGRPSRATIDLTAWPIRLLTIHSMKGFHLADLLHKLMVPNISILHSGSIVILIHCQNRSIASRRYFLSVLLTSLQDVTTKAREARGDGKLNLVGRIEN